MSKEMLINVLGTVYEIQLKSDKEDDLLNDYHGYCDETVKKIVIAKPPQNTEVGNYKVRQLRTLRHEIVHAFLCESGLEDNSWADNEEIVDWIAIQMPKLYKAMYEAEEQVNLADRIR